MFSRKFSSNIRRKKRMIILTVILLVMFLSTGYAVFTTNLSIGGTLNVSKYDHTLYGVLEKAAKKGTYAKEYTGEHHDSFTEEPSKKIYHWYGSNDSNGTAILDMNNVIFAGHCWQMIRTTDTGGVKMVYNGEPENGQCLNTRGNHVGYSSRTKQSMDTTYYYGTGYTYDKTNGVFSLDGDITTGTIQTGQYTCKQTTSTGTCTTLYLVDTLDSETTYYVLPLNGNSHYSQFGTLQFNQKDDSLADVGYMYNTRYTSNSQNIVTNYTMLKSATINHNVWYYDDGGMPGYGPTGWYFEDAFKISDSSQYASLVGKYTFHSTIQNNSNPTVRYIVAVNGSTYYYVELTAGEDISEFTFVYGDSYTNNGNDTYTINSPVTIEIKDWYTDYGNVGAGKYVCKNAVNNTCSDLWYTTATSNTSMSYINVESNYKYAKGFTWDGSKYTLDSNTSISFWDISDSTNRTNLNNAHYTCWNETGECTVLSYIYHRATNTLHYINLTNGKNAEDALSEMLSNNNVNQINSTIKVGIDAWYKRYMTSYTSRLEDTIFCNDRNIIYLGGWESDGGNLTLPLSFKNSNMSGDLSCTNITDKFSMVNAKATLTYPVGLLTFPETYLLNNKNIRKTGYNYLLIAPYHFSTNNAFEYYIYYTTGEYVIANLSNSLFGVRPAVSLTPGTEYTSGNGSMADPYVVDVPMGTLTINYRSETGTVLHEPLVVTLPIGASYSYKNPVLPGYQTDDEYTTGTLTLPISNLNVIYIVPPDNPPIIG